MLNIRLLTLAATLTRLAPVQSASDKPVLYYYGGTGGAPDENKGEHGAYLCDPYWNWDKSSEAVEIKNSNCVKDQSGRKYVWIPNLDGTSWDDAKGWCIAASESNKCNGYSNERLTVWLYDNSAGCYQLPPGDYQAYTIFEGDCEHAGFTDPWYPGRPEDNQ